MYLLYSSLNPFSPILVTSFPAFKMNIHYIVLQIGVDTELLRHKPKTKGFEYKIDTKVFLSSKLQTSTKVSDLRPRLRFASVMNFIQKGNVAQCRQMSLCRNIIHQGRPEGKTSYRSKIRPKGRHSKHFLPRGNFGSIVSF